MQPSPKALRELLLSLFSSAQLRIFIEDHLEQSHESQLQLTRCVNWSGPQIEVAKSLVDQLESRNLIDATLHRALIESRSLRRVDIDGVFGKAYVRKSVGAPPGCSPDDEGASNSGRARILMLASNPVGTDELRLDEECERIEAALGDHNPRYELRYRRNLGLDKLARELMRDPRPRIVHITGHGDRSGRLLFTASDGHKSPADPQAIANLLGASGEKVECVVLSACYSAPQARLIARHVKYVVGMAYAVEVEAATRFAEGFYEALGFGSDVVRAFAAGLNRLDLTRIPGSHVPRLWADRELHPSSPIPEIEDASGTV
jgi:hypothetical protein